MISGDWTPPNTGSMLVVTGGYSESLDSELTSVEVIDLEGAIMCSIADLPAEEATHGMGSINGAPVYCGGYER